MYRFAGIVGVNPEGYSYWQLVTMADAVLQQQWTMHGRLTLDIINSQRAKKDHISGVGMYPYFEQKKRKATQKDIDNLKEMLKDSKWLTVTTS